MAYATIDDVFKRYKPIRTIVGSEDLQVSSVDVTSIFIRDAESVVDAYLANKYSVPLAVVPSYITQVTADLAIFNILVEHLPQSPDFFKPRYDRAMDMLSAVMSGNMVITSVNAATAGDQEAWSTTKDYHAVFSPVIPPDDQTVDKERVDADVSDRSGDLGAPGSC